MHIGQALDLVSRYDSLRNPLTSLGDYLDPELISRCLAESGTVTLRKRRLPLEMMVWCIVGILISVATLRVFFLNFENTKYRDVSLGDELSSGNDLPTEKVSQTTLQIIPERLCG